MKSVNVSTVPLIKGLLSQTCRSVSLSHLFTWIDRENSLKVTFSFYFCFDSLNLITKCTYIIFSPIRNHLDFHV